MTPVQLTAALIEAFAGVFLSPRYDNAVATPDLHRECWGLYCSSDELVAVAAPREHAKSTALTHDFGLAAVLFRRVDYVCIVSAVEQLAIDHLGDIAKELRENEDLIREFKIKRLSVDAKTEVIVEFEDGHEARYIAKGSGQKMRGLKWNGKRPGLIIGDDLEEDEQVENADRRRKFRKWVFRAMLPARRRGGLVRIHGTILHEDSLLARLMKSKSWLTRRYKAHEAFDDFSNILWPEQFPEERLRKIRQTFIDDGDAPGYSQEYLNDPFDNSEAYIRKDDLFPMREEDFESYQMMAVGCDFAVSKADRANKTSFTIGGKDMGNFINIHDNWADRWDTSEWIDKMFEIQQRYHPQVFFVEDGVIWKSIAPTLYKEMQRRDQFLNCYPILPTRDKAVRGRPYQKHSRAGAMRYNKQGSWYEIYESIIMRFTGTSDAVQDDEFDSTAILVKGFELFADLEEEDAMDDDELEMRSHDPRVESGRSTVTGY